MAPLRHGQIALQSVCVRGNLGLNFKAVRLVLSGGGAAAVGHDVGEGEQTLRDLLQVGRVRVDGGGFVRESLEAEFREEAVELGPNEEPLEEFDELKGSERCGGEAQLLNERLEHNMRVAAEDEALNKCRKGGGERDRRRTVRMRRRLQTVESLEEINSVRMKKRH